MHMPERNPPGPRGHFLWGNLRDVRSGRLEFLTRCVRDYGDVVAFRFGPRRLLLFNHPDLVEEVLITHSRDFIKHFALRLNPLVFGRGLLTSEGDFWLRQRRLIQPAFTRNRIASAYVPAMVSATEAMLDNWKPGQTREILADMSQLTLRIATRTMFDAESSGDASEVGEVLQVLQENFLIRLNSLVPLPIWVPTPRNLRLRRVVRRLDRVLYGYIKQRRQAGVHKTDLLSILLQARDEDGSRMTDQQVRDEAMTLFLAGHETTALALSWTWYLLSQNPEAEERLLAEVDQVLGSRPPTADDLNRLSYTEKVALEGMRLYPPVHIIGREALRTCSIGGYRVPRGRTVIMSQWLLHRDPRFFDEPEKFRPERWTEEFQRQLPKFAYFPFGGGPRLCIGNTFAMMELVLVLASIARRFRFTLVPGHEVVPWPTFTLRPKNGILAVVRERHQSVPRIVAFAES
jgi:cytochrome P450